VKADILKFHDLRPNAATLMVMGGVDQAMAKENFGHSKIEMAMRYVHLTPENKRRAKNVLASGFESERGKKPVIIRSQKEIAETVSSLLSRGKN
jgi:integrase